MSCILGIILLLLKMPLNQYKYSAVSSFKKKKLSLSRKQYRKHLSDRGKLVKNRAIGTEKPARRGKIRRNSSYFCRAVPIM